MRASSLLVPALLTALCVQCAVDSIGDPWGGNVAISHDGNDQEHPAMIPDGSGNAIIVWSDQQIHAQKVDMDLAFQWGPDGVVVTSADGWQQVPRICSDASGGVIVAWEDCRNGSDNRDIFVQRISSSGAPAWTENGVPLATEAGDQNAVAIVSDGAGGAIVAWVTGDSDSGTLDVRAQRVDPDGAVQWTVNGVPVAAAAGNQSSPTLCPDGAGGAIVSWTDKRSGEYDIYAQRISAVGAAHWATDGVVVCSVTGNQLWPITVSDGLGGAIVAWEDNPFATTDLYAQRVNGSGVVQWTAGGIPVAVADRAQNAPVMIADGAGDFILAWTDYRSGIDTDVYAQKITAGGAVLWAVNGAAICDDADSQGFPQLAPDGAGGAFVVWEASRNAYDIYAQRVNGSGASLWDPQGVAICAFEASQWDPRIVPVGGGGAVIAWTDFRYVSRGYGRDLFADFISGEGIRKY